MALQKLRCDLYDAETLGEACTAILRVMPRWLPWVGAATFVAAYTTYIRVRIFIARWRRAARRRAERKFEALGSLQNTMSSTKCFSLADDDDGGDNDEDDDDDEDDSALTLSDIEEFRCSLGIRCPRDEDLLVIVEEMLLVDPVPDGWVLYRTTAGVVRFLNLNTQELFFFHPGKRAEERHILGELKRRNRVALESKYLFCDQEEENGRRRGTTSTSRRQQQQQHQQQQQQQQRLRNGGRMDNDGTVLSFSDDNDDDMDTRDEQSTFRRMFNYFVERERRRIEKDVEKKYRQPSAGSTNGNSSSGTLGTPKVDGRSVRVMPMNTVHSAQLMPTPVKRTTS